MTTTKYGTSDIDNLMYESSQVDKLIFSGLTVWEGIWPGWTGLLSYWRFDENTLTTAYDSKASIDGTLTGVGTQWGTGMNNSCVDTQGLNSSRYVNCGNNYNYDGEDEWSWAFWMKRPVTTKQNVGMIMKMGAGDVGYRIFMGGDGTITLYLKDGSSGVLTKNTTSTELLTNTDWNHLVWTYSGSETYAGLKLYFNGTEITSWTNVTETLSGTLTNTGNLGLAGVPLGAAWYSTGLFDECGHWNRPITQTEVTTLYNSGSGIFY